MKKKIYPHSLIYVITIILYLVILVLSVYVNLMCWYKIKTPKDTFIPALINIPPVTIDGMSTCDLNINITMSSCDIVGKFYAQNVENSRHTLYKMHKNNGRFLT